MTLPELGYTQENIHCQGYAIQCRVTTGIFEYQVYTKDILKTKYFQRILQTIFNQVQGA